MIAQLSLPHLDPRPSIYRSRARVDMRRFKPQASPLRIDTRIVVRRQGERKRPGAIIGYVWDSRLGTWRYAVALDAGGIMEACEFEVEFR